MGQVHPVLRLPEPGAKGRARLVIQVLRDEDRRFGPRWCHKCHCYCPPRSFHCPSCNVCVEVRPTGCSGHLPGNMATHTALHTPAHAATNPRSHICVLAHAAAHLHMYPACPCTQLHACSSIPLHTQLHPHMFPAHPCKELQTHAATPISPHTAAHLHMYLAHPCTHSCTPTCTLHTLAYSYKPMQPHTSQRTQLHPYTRTLHAPANACPLHVYSAYPCTRLCSLLTPAHACPFTPLHMQLHPHVPYIPLHMQLQPIHVPSMHRDTPARTSLCPHTGHSPKHTSLSLHTPLHCTCRCVPAHNSRPQGTCPWQASPAIPASQLAPHEPPAALLPAATSPRLSLPAGLRPPLLLAEQLRGPRQHPLLLPLRGLSVRLQCTGAGLLHRLPGAQLWTGPQHRESLRVSLERWGPSVQLPCQRGAHRGTLTHQFSHTCCVTHADMRAYLLCSSLLGKQGWKRPHMVI